MITIGQLIIVAGASGAGKSALMQRIRLGESSNLCQKLGITTSPPWEYVSAYQLVAAMPKEYVERIMIHYDLWAQYSEENGFALLDDLLARSETVTILTLNISPALLVRRTNFRILGRVKSLFHPRVYKKSGEFSRIAERIQILWKRRAAYKRAYSLVLYDHWLVYFGANKVAAHWLVDSSNFDYVVKQVG